MNHYAGKVVVNAQENLMKTRDERIALMNEILGAIRMVKVKFPFFIYYTLLMVPECSSWLGNGVSRSVFSLSDKESLSIKN